MTILATVLDYLDVLLLLVITAIAYDALRQLDAKHHPARAAAFSFISVGAFGWTMVDLGTTHVPWWAFVFHLGVAVHSVIRFSVRNSKEERYGVSRVYHR